MNELPERRHAAPYIPDGCGQQSRLPDGRRITLAALDSREGAAGLDFETSVASMRAHRRMAAWARGLLLSILALLALVGAGALYGAAERYFTTTTATPTTTTRTTT